MPKPKVFREYFPTCVERFFGSGKPRRIKARCFVPYTQQEQNTDVYLGPSRDAPNIDLNMSVHKDKFGGLTCSPDEGPFNTIGPCHDRDQDVWDENRCARERPCDCRAPRDPCGPCAPCTTVPHLRKPDCGCSCRCSETSSECSSCSCSCTCASKTKSSSKCESAGRPRILVLENDGRYRPLGGDNTKKTTISKGNLKKSRSKISQRKPKLVVKDKKVEVVDLSENTLTASDWSPTPAECSLEVCTKEKTKNGVVVGYVMYDPQSEDKRPYVTTVDGKRITQNL